MASKHTKKQIADTNLMMLAALAAILIGAFAFFILGSGKISAPLGPEVKTMTIILNAQNASGESGTALLKEVNGKVVVDLNLKGAPKAVAQPAHIHLGNCPNPGSIKYALKSPVNGVSETILDLTFDKLKALGNLAINVHKSPTQAGTFVSCGNLNL